MPIHKLTGTNIKIMKNWKDPIHPGEILADELDAIDTNVAELTN
ncbi:MAG: hypothetical protein SCALA701_19150 [Candidatus Scalindua sp.]|nr:MAG: hypothetical protein SCALA701_19150 [Candidatus Scalindua sp.]